MPLEVKNVAKQDFHAPSPERKWINNLGVAFQRVQYVINAAAMRAVPDSVLQPPPSIVVVPDTEFDSLVITGVNNATPQDARLATRKKKELVQGSKTTVVGMYLNNDATILLPERTAKEFQ